MALEVRRKKGENTGSFIFRFNKRTRQSGLIKEIRKRRFRSRPQNRMKRRLGAIYRINKKEELNRLKKYGSERKTK